MAKLLSKNVIRLEDGNIITDRLIRFSDGTIFTIRSKPSWYDEKPYDNKQLDGKTQQELLSYYQEALDAGILR